MNTLTVESTVVHKTVQRIPDKLHSGGGSVRCSSANRTRTYHELQGTIARDRIAHAELSAAPTPERVETLAADGLVRQPTQLGLLA